MIACFVPETHFEAQLALPSLAGPLVRARTSQIHYTNLMSNIEYWENIWWHRHLPCAVLNRMEACSTIFNSTLLWDGPIACL